jgi:thiol:disulfide interchange protein DsbD
MIVTITLMSATISIGSTTTVAPPVFWDFRALTQPGNEVIVEMTATMDPGWHIYSQRMKDKGPQPTSIRYEPNDDATPLGGSAEIGKAVTFRDSIYDMDIIWYAGTVSFRQSFRLDVPQTTIRGKIHYQLCNDLVCILDKREFAIAVHASN